MRLICWLLVVILQIWVLCAIARAVLSWFPVSSDSPAGRINSILVAITEPLIAPVRRLISPVRVGGVGLDVSFIVVILVLQIFVIPFLARLAA